MTNQKVAQRHTSTLFSIAAAKADANNDVIDLCSTDLNHISCLRHHQLERSCGACSAVHRPAWYAETTPCCRRCVRQGTCAGDLCWKNISSTCCGLHLKPVGAHPHRRCCIVLPHVCVMFRVGGGQGLFQDVVCEDGSCTLVSVPFVVCASLSIINNLFIVAVFPCWPPKACSLNHVWL